MMSEFMADRSTIYLRNILTFCLVGYFLCYLAPATSLFWRLMIVSINIYCVLLKRSKFGFNRIQKHILLLYVLLLIYFFVAYFWKQPSITTIGNVSVALTTILGVAYLGEKGVITPKYLLVTCILILIVKIPYFYYHQALSLAEVNSQIAEYGGSTKTAVTNNASTTFVLLLPMVLLIKDRLFKIVLFCVCLFFILLGVKRGNIVAAILPLLIFVINMFKENKNKSFFKIFLLIGFVFLIYAINDFVSHNELFLERLELTLEGNSSGRDDIYANLWNAWSNTSSLKNILFGYGFLETIELSLSNRMAHSDWLELLVDLGLLGVVVYLSLLIAFVSYYFRIKDFTLKYCWLSIAIIWFLRSVYSMSVFDEELCLLAFPMAYIWYHVKSNTR